MQLNVSSKACSAHSLRVLSSALSHYRAPTHLRPTIYRYLFAGLTIVNAVTVPCRHESTNYLYQIVLNGEECVQGDSYFLTCTWMKISGVEVLYSL